MTDLLPQRIKTLRDALALNQADFGKLVGVTQPTVSRWEKGEQTPEYEHVVKLARLANVSVDDFGEVYEHDSPHMMIDDAMFSIIDHQVIFVMGEVQAGVWRESLIWHEDDHVGITVRLDPNLGAVERFALQVKGTSMDIVYPDQTILVCVSPYTLKRDPVPGERVIVERRSPTGQYEGTVKELAVDDQGKKWLVPRSNDPRFQAPIPLDSKEGSGEEIEITGIVTASIRWEPIAERK